MVMDIAQKWRMLDDTAKDRYKEMARRESERYKKQKIRYKENIVKEAAETARRQYQRQRTAQQIDLPAESNLTSYDGAGFISTPALDDLLESKTPVTTSVTSKPGDAEASFDAPYPAAHTPRVVAAELLRSTNIFSQPVVPQHAQSINPNSNAHVQQHPALLFGTSVPANSSSTSALAVLPTQQQLAFALAQQCHPETSLASTNLITRSQLPCSPQNAALGRKMPLRELLMRELLLQTEASEPHPGTRHTQGSFLFPDLSGRSFRDILQQQNHGNVAGFFDTGTTRGVLRDQAHGLVEQPMLRQIFSQRSAERAELPRLLQRPCHPSSRPQHEHALPYYLAAALASLGQGHQASPFQRPSRDGD